MASRISTEVFDLLTARSAGRCERCTATLGGQFQLHHRKGKQFNAVTDLVVLCGSSATDGRSCHWYIECKERFQAEIDGWIVRRHALTECRNVPVFDIHVTGFWLLEDGTKVPFKTTGEEK